MGQYTMDDTHMHYQPKATHWDQKIALESMRSEYAGTLSHHGGFQERQWYSQQSADCVERLQP